MSNGINYKVDCIILDLLYTIDIDNKETYLAYAINPNEYLITKIESNINKIEELYQYFKRTELFISTKEYTRRIDFFEIEQMLSPLQSI